MRDRIVPVLAILNARVEIGGRGRVGFVEHRNDAQENGPNILRDAPALAGLLSAALVVARFVKDGDADASVGIDIGMPDFGEELQRRRSIRIVQRKREHCLVVPAGE